MADIPLFTGAANIGPSQGPAPIPQIDPAAYVKGAQAAQQMGATTTLGSIAQGVTKGVNAYQQTAGNAQKLEMNEQAIAQNNIQLQQQQLQLQLDQQLAPLKMKAAISLTESQALRQAAEAEETIQGVELAKEQRAKKAKVNSIFSGIKQGNIEAGMAALEQNMPDLMETSVNLQGSGDKKKVVVDPVILNQIAALPALAKRTGNPETIRRAESIVGQYQDTVNRLTSIEEGNAISLSGEKDSGKEAKDYTQFVLERAGAVAPVAKAVEDKSLAAIPVPTDTTDITPAAPVLTNPAGETAPVASPVASPVAAPNRGGYRSPESQPFTFPAEMSTPPSAVTGAAPSNAEQQTVSKKVLDSPPDHYLDKVGVITEQLKQNNPKLAEKDAIALADTIASKSDFKATEIAEVTRIQNVAQQTQLNAQRARATTKRLQELMTKAKITPAEGSTMPMSRMWEEITSRIGTSEANRQLVDNVRAEFKALGQGEMITTLGELKLGQQLANTPEEQKAMRSLSFSDSNTFERNLQALEVVEGKAQEFQDVGTIVEVYRRFGYNYSDAIGAANRYRNANPRTTIGEINGVPFVRRNENRTGPLQFTDQALGLEQRTYRNAEGRAVTSTPANPTKLSAEVGAKKSDISYSPNASDVPARQPGGVNRDTVLRMISAESSWNPKKDSPAGAQGLMQLMPATGRELWKEMGFEGAYDPYDNEKNVLMGTTYMNKMLQWFDNDTELALAAYNAGPGTISKAYQKAEKALGDTSWDAVKLYLPEKAKKETIPYVDKIMRGDGLDTEIKAPLGPELENVFASLSTNKAQNNARATLSPDGTAALKEVAAAKTFNDVANTPFANVVKAFLDANPLAPATAEAQSPDEVISDARDVSAANEGSWLSMPDSMQAFALGSVRTALFGFDDEIGAGLRMAVLGEDYDTAVENTRAIRDTFQQENPNLYLTGEIGGAFLGGGAIGVGAKAVGMSGKAATAAPSVLKTVAKGAAAGAIQGGITGGGEGEGNAGNRVARAFEGVAVGSVFGGALSGAVAVGAKVAKGTFSKLRQVSQGEGASVQFTAPEKELLKQFGDATPEKFQQMKAALQSSDNEAFQFIDTLGDVKVKELAKSITASSAGANLAEDFATERLSGTQRRVAQVLDDYSDDVAPERAFADLAQSAEKDATRLATKRAAEAEVLYSEAQDALPKIPPKSKVAKSTSTVALDEEGSALVDQYNRAISDGTISTNYNPLDIPKEVPGFVSKEVRATLKDPYIKEAVEKAHTLLKDGGALDDMSFNVMQMTKAVLRDDSENLTNGLQRNLAGKAHAKLQSALYDENKLYQAADTAYREGSDEMTKLGTKFVQDISKFAGEGDVANIEKLGNVVFGADAETLKKTMAAVSPETQQSIKNAARAHLINLVEKKGDMAGKALPDFSKDKIPGKIKAIFGDEAGDDIVKRLQEEARITKTGNVIGKAGDTAATRIAAQKETLSSGMKADFVRAVGLAATGGGIGSSFGAAGAALGAAGGAIIPAGSGIKKMLNISKLNTKADLASEFGRILTADRDEAIVFIDKVLQNLDNENSPHYRAVQDAYMDALRAAVRAGGSAGQLGSAAGNDFEPDSRERNRAAIYQK